MILFYHTSDRCLQDLCKHTHFEILIFWRNIVMLSGDRTKRFPKSIPETNQMTMAAM